MNNTPAPPEKKSSRMGHNPKPEGAGQAKVISDGDKKPRKAKPPLALVPFLLLLGVARVLAYGAKKYAPWNWTKAEPNQETLEEYQSAAYRHLGNLTNGEFGAIDAESGELHIDHAITSLLILRYHLLRSRPDLKEKYNE